MREHKYQAWQKHHKEMFEVGAIQFREPRFVVKKDSSETWTFDEVELREFTGLHDKQGKEIWEGDIVHYEYSYPKDKPFVVKFDTQEFADSDYQAFCIGYNLDPTATEHYTIIGNIYQNPELMPKESN